MRQSRSRSVRMVSFAVGPLQLFRACDVSFELKCRCNVCYVCSATAVHAAAAVCWPCGQGLHDPRRTPVASARVIRQ
eukprot:2208-Eustigmatos_ZCMA.PRE.1